MTSTRTKYVSIALVLFLSCVGSSFGKIFLKFNPTVQGDAMSIGYEGQIELMSASFSAPGEDGGGKHPTKGQVLEFSLEKSLDRASAALLKAALNGQLFKTATITFVEYGSETAVPYLTIEIANPEISSVGLSGDEDSHPSENIILKGVLSKFDYAPEPK